MNPLVEKITSNISVVSGCWEWQKGCDRDGYGRLYAEGRCVLAHRASYETFVGKIPVGLQIDHLCRNRKCVNPDHLEAVTAAENMRRGPNRKRAICANGHEQNIANTRETVRPNGEIHRACRPCEAAASRRYKERATRRKAA